MATATQKRNSLGNQGKITKSRARNSVKPILKKLHSTHSEKNSLDLDRGWDEQTAQLGYIMTDNDYYDNINASPGGIFGSSASYPFPPTRDVSFTLSTIEYTKATPITPTTTNSTSATSACPSTCNNLSHARSTSGASHISVTTSNSGRNGSFVHPFQQTPRTSTPPLVSCAGSLTSLDQSNIQPNTIAENEDDTFAPVACQESPSKAYQPSLPPSRSNRISSVAASQQSTSMSDAVHPLRVATSRTGSGTTSRLVHPSSAVSQTRYSDLQLSTTTQSVTIIEDSPVSPASTSFSSPKMYSSTSASAAVPMSPARSSLDMHNFRIRSRSDVDAHTRQQEVRDARRRFEEKEKAKEAKYQREQMRKREREDSKEAQRQAASIRKGSYSRTSSSIDLHLRPAVTRKSTATSRLSIQAERPTGPDFASRGYDEMDLGNMPPTRADNVHFESYKSNRTSGKRKTSGSWTAFMLWFRTRLLKLGRR